MTLSPGDVVGAVLGDRFGGNRDRKGKAEKGLGEVNKASIECRDAQIRFAINDTLMYIVPRRIDQLSSPGFSVDKIGLRIQNIRVSPIKGDSSPSTAENQSNKAEAGVNGLGGEDAGEVAGSDRARGKEAEVAAKPRPPASRVKGKAKWTLQGEDLVVTNPVDRYPALRRPFVEGLRLRIRAPLGSQFHRVGDLPGGTRRSL